MGETEGTVEHIEVRVTRIRTYDGRLVLVPNSEIFTSRVVNNTASPLRRSSIMVPIDYRQDLKLAMATIGQAARSIGDVATHPPPEIVLRDLAPGHYAIEARFWTEARRPDFTITSGEVREAIVRALQAAGIGMPNPGVRTINPGDVERWSAVFSGTASAPRS